MSRSLLHDWEHAIDRCCRDDNPKEMISIAEDIYNTAYVRGQNHSIELEEVLDKIRAEISDCLKALDEIEKSGLNIYLPNEITARRLTYQQCLGFIDKYKAESEDKE